MEIRKRQARKTIICEGKQQNSYQNAMIKFSACRFDYDKIYLRLFPGIPIFMIISGTSKMNVDFVTERS